LSRARTPVGPRAACHGRAALARAGFNVRETIPIGELDRLRPWLALPAAERPLVVAAGGDGTVGAVADAVAHTGAILGILPLGTSNDVARSLDIPRDLARAVRLLAVGSASTVDLGQFVAADGTPRHFIHAAALGLNVAFARVAMRASLRKRLGRLTYMVAASALLLDEEWHPLPPSVQSLMRARTRYTGARTAAGSRARWRRAGYRPPPTHWRPRATCRHAESRFCLQ